MKRRLLELALVTASVVCLSKAGWTVYRYQYFQNQPLPKRFLLPASTSHANGDRGTYNTPILGQLSIPRLRVSAVMVEGDDDESLSLAAGHMKGTAPIGSKGNTIIAGHRDTVFWPLRNIKAGDSIVVSTDKQYVYTVEKTQIVDPSNTDALQDSQQEILTLITCYPFRHIGSSPKRFIVTAKLSHPQS